MAPHGADAAVATQRQQRQPKPPRQTPFRIVPAVPLALSRAPPAARPITPVESTAETVTQPEPEPQAPAVDDAPPTPDSRAPASPPAEADASEDSVEAPLEATASVTAPEKPKARTPFDGKEAPFQPPSIRNVSHEPQPGVEGLVFGGAAQESPALPSTPHELDPEAPAPQLTYTRPPPGFAPPPFAPPFYPGHSHHPSDSAASWLHPTYSMAPPDAVYTNGAEYHPPSFPAGPVPYQGLYQAPFSPRGLPMGVNGAARSHSQSPSKPASDFDDDSRVLPHQNATSLPAMDNMEESPFELASYLSSQFGNPDFADFVLHIHHGEAVVLSMPVHGIVVARSPAIADAMCRSVPLTLPSKSARRLAELPSPDGFVTTESLSEAIKLLYGAPLLPIQPFLYGLRPFAYEGQPESASIDARKRMEQAISYAAAGRLLQVPIVQARGLEIAKALLRWDTLEQAVHYALDGSRAASRTKTSGSDLGAHDTFETTFLNHVIDFIAYNFPVDFTLYKLAPELRQNPRLPSVVEPRAPSHNPRLSKIRFGDAPPEDNYTPSLVAQTLSSLLLSLPLPLVEALFNHRATANQIGWTGAANAMRDVVAEREGRRQRVLTSRMMHAHNDAVPALLMDNLRREERVAPSSAHPSGFQLEDAPVANGVS